MNFQVLDNRVLLKIAAPETKTKGGIVLVDNESQFSKATVVNVGGGKVLDNGLRARPALHEGQTVLVLRHVGHEVQIDGEKYRICTAEQIEGVFNEEGVTRKTGIPGKTGDERVAAWIKENGFERAPKRAFDFPRLLEMRPKLDPTHRIVALPVIDASLRYIDFDADEVITITHAELFPVL